MKKSGLLLALSFCASLGFAQGKIELKTELQDTAPKFMMQGGKAAGLCVDIMALLEAKEGFKFSYPAAFVPSKRIEANIESGAADVHFGWAKTADREKMAKFGEELYKVSYLGVVRNDDKADFKTPADLSKLGDQGIVLSVFGVASTAKMKKIAGLRVDDAGKDVKQNLDKLAAGRGRVFIYQNLAIAHELGKPENKGKFKTVKIDFGDNPDFKATAQYLAFSPKVAGDTVQKLNAAVAKHRGEIDAIVKKYTQ